MTSAAKKTAFILSLLVLMLCLFTGSAMAAEYSVNDHATDYNLSAVLLINGQTTGNVSRLEQDDEFELRLTWYLPTGSTITPDDVFVYDISDALALRLTDVPAGDVTGGDEDPTVYGTYRVEGNKLYVQYNDALLSLGNRRSGINIPGRVDVTTVSNNEDGRYVVHIPGMVDWETTLYTNTGLKIDKTAVKSVDNTNHRVLVDYKITVTALTRNTKVQLKDYFVRNFGDSVSEATGSPFTVKIIRDGSVINTFTRSDKIHSGRNGSDTVYILTAADDITLEKDDVLEVTYSVRLKDLETRSTEPEAVFRNTATVQSNECSPLSDNTETKIKRPWIQKYGNNTDAPGCCRWFITVCRGEFSTLVVSDIPGNGLDSCPDDTQVTIYKGTREWGNLTGATVNIYPLTSYLTARPIR